jgi:hypothetical protein
VTTSLLLVQSSTTLRVRFGQHLIRFEIFFQKPVILISGFNDFSSVIPINAGIVLLLDKDRFLPNPSPLNFLQLVLYNLSSWMEILSTTSKVRGSNPGGGEIFSTRPDRPWGPPSLLYNGYRVIPGVKRPGRGVDRPTPSSAEVKERVELYLYSPSGPSSVLV